MGRIRILPDHVANKIAAGEVVERPASVVKELLENSLDAASGRIRIQVEAGGKRRIQIVDDGSGMIRDDAMLAFERHATSKLRDASDLLAIDTLGFRGEALPSIAAVSRLTLSTRTADAVAGFRLTVDLAQQTVAYPDGSRMFRFEVDPFRKSCLLNGLDEIGLTLRHADKIRAFEERRKAEQPWLFS